MKLSDIRIKAVVLGVLADIAGSIIVGIGLSIVIMAIAAIGHDLSRSHWSVLRQSVPLRLFGLLGTSISTCIGGYVAARLGRPFEFFHSFSVGVVCVVLAIGLSMMNPCLTRMALS